MNIFFDTEFIEDGERIYPISIGLVREDGEVYYAEWMYVPWERANNWVVENVRPHLRRGDALKHRHEIAHEIVEFVGKRPRFWAYYADYDWIVLCQLYGRMLDLPKGWPMFCLDIKQLAVMLGDPTLPEQTTTEHHALADALWNFDAYEFLVGYSKVSGWHFPT